MTGPIKKHHYVLAALAAGALIVGGLTFFPRETNHSAPTLPSAIPPVEQAGTLSALPNPAPVQNMEMMEPAAGTIAPEIAPTSEQAAAQTPAEQIAAPALDLEDPAWMEPRGLKIGNPKAPVKIKEFSSLSCSHCAHFHTRIYPELKKKYIQTGKVEFEFTPFPLNAPALDGALAVNCLPEERRYSFMSLLMETQEHWAFAQDHRTPLRQNAMLAGLSDSAFDACLKNPIKRAKLVEQVKAASEKYNVESTPTFVFNDGADVMMGAQPLEAFSAKIDHLLTQKK